MTCSHISFSDLSDELIQQIYKSSNDPEGSLSLALTCKVALRNFLDPFIQTHLLTYGFKWPVSADSSLETRFLTAIDLRLFHSGRIQLSENPLIPRNSRFHHFTYLQESGLLLLWGPHHVCIQDVNARTARFECSLEEDDEITCLTFNPTQNILVTGHNDLSITQWDTRTHEFLNYTLPMSPTCMAFSPEGTTLYLGGSDNRYMYWDISANLLRTVILCPDYVTGRKAPSALSFLPEGNHVFFSNNTVQPEEKLQDTLSIFNLETEIVERVFPLNAILGSSTITCAAPVEAFNSVVCAYSNAQGHHLDGGKHSFQNAHADTITKVVMMKDKTTAISASLDGFLKFWNIEKGILIHAKNFQDKGGIKDLWIDPANAQLFALFDDGSLSSFILECVPLYQGEGILEPGCVERILQICNRTLPYPPLQMTTRAIPHVSSMSR